MVYKFNTLYAITFDYGDHQDIELYIDKDYAIDTYNCCNECAIKLEELRNVDVNYSDSTILKCVEMPNDILAAKLIKHLIESTNDATKLLTDMGVPNNQVIELLEKL